MNRSSLSTTVLDQLKSWRRDRIIEKHEGPESWESTLEYTDPEFIEIAGHQVLLPVDREHHPNMTILRCIASEDRRTLTIFLKDTTYVPNPRDEYFSAGYVAVRERFPGQDFYAAILYHEWFTVDNRVLVQSDYSSTY
jgi:hypothetical protein